MKYFEHFLFFITKNTSFFHSPILNSPTRVPCTSKYCTVLFSIFASRRDKIHNASSIADFITTKIANHLTGGGFGVPSLFWYNHFSNSAQTPNTKHPPLLL